MPTTTRRRSAAPEEKRDADRPSRRPLQIYAFDPMIVNAAHMKAKVSVPYEELEPGPRGSRLAVIDYDGDAGTYHAPVNLDDPWILMQGGLTPSESDYRFHQQMVYAVGMRVIETFESALGRRIRFWNGAPLPILPHAFRGRNAFFDPATKALYFGWFQADRENPGPNLPGQAVYTCLSHDIVCHELTHALYCRIRPGSTHASNPDVLALHEGLADLVAIFLHFSYPEVVRHVLLLTDGRLDKDSLLTHLAQQFGHAAGLSSPLRSALGGDPDPGRIRDAFGPHERGAILVAAVFDAFLRIYRRRSEDLFRLAGGRASPLHPDLVDRLQDEAIRTAESLLRMCLRAIDFLPPSGMTFGDYLRSLITADRELWPVDRIGQRAILVDCFRQRGLLPTGVHSLSEEALLWTTVSSRRLQGFPGPLVAALLEWNANAFRRALSGRGAARPRRIRRGSADLPGTLARALHAFAESHWRELDLAPPAVARTAIQGFHPMVRWAEANIPIVDLAFTVTQTPKKAWQKVPDLGGLPVTGGTTVIAHSDGTFRYVISRPMPKSPAEARETAEFVLACDERDPRGPWRTAQEHRTRQLARSQFRSLHEMHRS